MNSPITMKWDGEAMRPASLIAARKAFESGQSYPLVIHEERSDRSHSHYFAVVNEAWKNLPESLTKKHPSAEHLRRWALVKAGYADERSIVCDSNSEALKVASFVKPIDDYAVVVVRDDVVRVFTARSQSAKAMDKKEFQESKTAVLEIVAELIGVEPSTLSTQVSSQAAPQASETEKPAAEALPLPNAAGNPFDWRPVYIRHMESQTEASAKSLLSRHTAALAEIREATGKDPEPADVEEMRAIYGLRQRNLTGVISADDYRAGLREIVGELAA